VSSSWEEVNPAGLSRSEVSSSWEEVNIEKILLPTQSNLGDDYPLTCCCSERSD
jgi:hypothetical protein